MPLNAEFDLRRSVHESDKSLFKDFYLGQGYFRLLPNELCCIKHGQHIQKKVILSISMIQHNSFGTNKQLDVSYISMIIIVIVIL